jgi:hypothetical protein
MVLNLCGLNKKNRHATCGAYLINTAKDHLDEHSSDYNQETIKILFLYHCPALVPPVTGWISVKISAWLNYLDLILEGKNEACGRASEASADRSDFLEQSHSDDQLAPPSQEGTSTSSP